MPRPFRWFHIVLEVIGALTTIAGLGWLALYAFFYPFRHFTDGNCSPDTEQRVVNAPDGGAHNFKSFHRTCAAYDFFFAYLSTGNPNKGYEYEPILELKNVGQGRPPRYGKARIKLPSHTQNRQNLWMLMPSPSG
jgi:hypothetical protein